MGTGKETNRRSIIGIALVAVILLAGCMQVQETTPPQLPAPGYDLTEDVLMAFAFEGHDPGAGEWFRIELLSPEADKTVRVGLVLGGDEARDAVDPTASVPPGPCGYYFNHQQGLLLWGGHERTAGQVGPVVVGNANPNVMTMSSEGIEGMQPRVETVDLQADRPESIVVAVGHASEATITSASVRLHAGGEVHYRVVESGTLECRSGLEDFDEGTRVRAGNHAVTQNLADDYDVPAPSTLVFWANPSVKWELHQDGGFVKQGDNGLALLDLDEGDWRLLLPEPDQSSCLVLWRLLLHDYQQPDLLLATGGVDCAPNVPGGAWT